MGEQPTLVLVNRSRGALLFDQALLQKAGRLVRLAARGTEAWRLTRELLPQMVVFGFDLDDILAPELCRLVRENSRTRRIPLLFLADRSNPEEVDLCMSAGCNDVVFRPLHRSELDSRIERLLAIPPRRSVETLTRIELSERERESTMLGRTVNLSSTGMLLQVDGTLPPAARVMLQFFLEDPALPIRVRSEVVRAEFTGGVPRYGMRFVDLRTDERAKIDSFVRQVPEANA